MYNLRHRKGRAILFMTTSLVWLLYGNHTITIWYTRINPSALYSYTACARIPLQISCGICESPFFRLLRANVMLWLSFKWIWELPKAIPHSYWPFHLFTVLQKISLKEMLKIQLYSSLILGWLFFKKLPISMGVSHIDGCLTKRSG